MSATAWATAFNDPLRRQPPSTGVSSLRAAADAYRALDRTAWTAEQVAVELVHLCRVADCLALAVSALAARVAAVDGYGGGAEESPCVWVQNACRMTRPAASQRICVGEQMARLPRSVAAVENGDIGFAHLAHLARAAEDIAPSPEDAFDEEPLLERAKTLNVGRFVAVCHHARHAADPAAYAENEVRAAEGRRLELTPLEDGWLGVKGFLDPIAGAQVRAALEPLARPRGKDDRRPRDKRLADALVELSLHGLDVAAVPRSATQRAHVQVTTTLETLLGVAGAPAAEMEFSPPISAAMVQQLSCDSTVTRILLGSESAVIDVGRSKRVVPPSTRRALNARDRHCVWPGCDRPPSWTSAHHIVHWSRQGRTDLDNLVLLCFRHHAKVHEGRWKLVRTGDGTLLTIPPAHEMRHLVPPPGDSTPLGDAGRQLTRAH